MKFKGMIFIACLNKAIMALMLAANPRNLFHNTTGKHCLDYFVDFQVYLRQALRSEDYHRFSTSSPEKIEPFFLFVLKLLQGILSLFFLRLGDREGPISLIEKLVPQQKEETSSLCLSLSVQDEVLRAKLRQYPSGPLMQILEIFKEEQEKKGFDPLMQYNLPGQLFTISSEQFHTTVLHMPCPVHQEFIDKPVVVDEFKSFLRGYGSKKYLLFNLQDRTSWQEHSRCTSLEKMQKEAEFIQTLMTITLAKNTDFYHQSQHYADLSDALSFKEQLKDQLLSGQQCGFYFPHPLQPARVQALIDFIGEMFFAKKESLNRKERLDFIEIFYFFLELDLIGENAPDLTSFMCKDGIDTGAAAAALFFGCARLLVDSSPWTEEEKRFFLYTLQTPALLLRHRPIDSGRIHRALSALGHFEEALKHQRNKILVAYSKLFIPIKVKQAA